VALNGGFHVIHSLTGSNPRYALAPEIERLLHKYRDQPISLADACLIHLAGEIGTGDIFTLDHDFEVYRWGRNRAFRLLIPLG
jgi:hypothetical protein